MADSGQLLQNSPGPLPTHGNLREERYHESDQQSDWSGLDRGRGGPHEQARDYGRRTLRSRLHEEAAGMGNNPA